MAKKKNTTKIESIHHNDKRKNIPTRELRDFVVKDEEAPKTMRYPRDPSLDPQLVWEGKEKQNDEDLAVPIVPIYIQEKINPHAIIAALPRIEKSNAEQFNFFTDFNGEPKDFSKKVDFYRYENDWSNRLILGDSLLVMSSLAEKEGLKGKVQTIYFDPPYGIKFGSNWQVSTRKRDVKDGKAEDTTRQPEQIKAFRDTWKLGIHSYLAYLRDRLAIARELLTETGSVFVQIGDENVHRVRCVLDEVFGDENCVGIIVVQKTGGLSQSLLPQTADYLLWYARDLKQVKYRQLYFEKLVGRVTGYQYIELKDGTRRRMSSAEQIGDAELPKGSRVFQPTSLESANPYSEYTFEGKSYRMRWKTRNPEGLDALAAARRLFVTPGSLRYVRYLDDFPVLPVTNVWTDTGSGSFLDPQIYVVQTVTKVIQRCLLMTTDPGDLVLDPTCGSGTTAYVAEQWGRRWITCDTSRVALALARTRLMAARYPYYLLADSPDGIQKESDLTGETPPDHKAENDIKKGFVYKRVPHVTLKSIANNPDIKEGMTRKQIDEAIARHADTETLYDQPYEDKQKIRVCGKFSVESLSPHRVLSTADENQDGAVSEQEAQKHQDFTAMILDNLRKAGVQNTHKDERIKFDRLDPYPGEYLHAKGEFTDADQETRRVAVSIGPEHGTVGPGHVKDAAKEAVRGEGFHMLIVCGFAFDPHVSEEAKLYGGLTVLPAKMNPDLAMGEDLLKKTGAGNLFMVFGEPDMEIKKQKAGQLIVEIKGLDVYDPTTGQIRSSSTDDIACWFIDTDYDSESFFVRHAYFTGADDPYQKLKRTLRAEIDEAAWSSLYSTKSRPFEKPKSGKIAIKVINHYGDEVLKVFSV